LAKLWAIAHRHDSESYLAGIALAPVGFLTRRNRGLSPIGMILSFI